MKQLRKVAHAAFVSLALIANMAIGGSNDTATLDLLVNQIPTPACCKKRSCKGLNIYLCPIPGVSIYKR